MAGLRPLKTSPVAASQEADLADGLGRASPVGRGATVVALLLTVGTGFSGLVYEVVWQKYLATLLGSHSEATASVLGIFLAGLSLGYALFGRVARALVTRAAVDAPICTRDGHGSRGVPR